MTLSHHVGKGRLKQVTDNHVLKARILLANGRTLKQAGKSLSVDPIELDRALFRLIGVRL